MTMIESFTTGFTTKASMAMTKPMDIDECKEWLSSQSNGTASINFSDALLALEALEEYWLQLYRDNDE